MDSAHKRIALNTIYLYVSSIIQLVLGLYTSRYLLISLGVTDFGIFGVVGGIIFLFSFINSALSGASSRYLTVELVKGDTHTQQIVFTTVVIAHLLIAILTLVGAETLGLWYVCNSLDFPVDRTTAVHWVYQLSILIALINIVQVPFSSSVLAHEKVSFLSIWNTTSIFLRFIVIFLLQYFEDDHLILYTILLALVNLVILGGYVLFCVYKFRECRLVYRKHYPLLKEMMAFTGYNTFNSLSTALRTQGTSLIINKFFGVLLNAANSISSMVSGYILGFTWNVVTAFRPQIVKAYASNDIPRMQRDVVLCVEFCIAIYSYIAVPIILLTEQVLEIWLKTVPEHTAIFCRIALLGSIFGLLNSIVVIVIQATTKIRSNSINVCIASALALVFMSIAFLFGFPAYVAFIILAITEFCILLISLYGVKKLLPEVSVFLFLRRTFRVLFLVLLAGGIVYSLNLIMAFPSLFQLIFVAVAYAVVFSTLFYFFVLDKDVRVKVLSKIGRVLPFSRRH